MGRLHRFDSPYLSPLDFHPLYNVSGMGGALLWTGIAARASGETPRNNFLEGCVRAKIDNRPMQLISSGTEDFFSGTLYFDNGADVYHSDIAGTTQWGSSPNKTGKPRPFFSAYRFHDSEVLVHSESMLFTWRCGDTWQCVEDGPVLYNASGAEAHSQVLAYNWPLSQSETR